MKQLDDRRFVKFDSVQLDVNTIQALAYQLQERKGLDANGKPVVVNIQVAVLMLEGGSSVTIDGESLKKLEYWWKKNVPSEDVVLPTPKVETTIEAAVVPQIATNPSVPVANAPEPVAPAPVKDLPVAAPASPAVAQAQKESPAPKKPPTT